MVGTVVKRGDSYRAVVRKVGHPVVTKTFNKAALAKKWIAETEHAMEQRELHSRHIDIGNLTSRYLKESITPISAKYRDMLTFIAKITNGLTFDDLTTEGLLAWKKKRCPGVSPASFSRYVTCIASVMNHAEAVWKLTPPWKEFRRARSYLFSVGLMSESNLRDRRPTDEEIAAIKSSLNTVLPIPDIIDFAVATAMRVGEICKVKWEDVDYEKRLIVIRDRKHPRIKSGNNSVIPLLGDSLDIIVRQERTVDPRIFPFRVGSVQMAFNRAKAKAGVEDLTIHDLRHHAISRLFEMGYSIPEVCIVSGHHGWDSLKRYTNLRPESLHR